MQTAFIGDSVLTTPLVRAAREIFPRPESQIEMMVSPLGENIFANNPHIDDVIVYDKRNSEKGILPFLALANRIRKKKFDTAILPHRSYRTGLICKMASIPRRIGFDGSAGRMFYTEKVDRPAEIHETERMLRLLRPIGKTPKALPTELFPDREDYRIADSFISSHNLVPSRTAIIAPGSVWGTKRYPTDRFAKVIDELMRSGNLDNAIIIGGLNEREIAERIIDASSERVFSAIGIGDIMTSAALIDRCRILIGNDSAPVHIAAAMKTPVVAILGPTIPEFGFTPYFEKSIVIQPNKYLECRPCSGHGKKKCPRHDCMLSISPQKIVEATFELLK